MDASSLPLSAAASMLMAGRINYAPRGGAEQKQPHQRRDTAGRFSRFLRRGSATLRHHRAVPLPGEEPADLLFAAERTAFFRPGQRPALRGRVAKRLYRA